MYTRENPSPDFRAMIEMNTALHEQGAATERADEKKSPDDTFSGKMILEHAATIAELTARDGSQTLLDYGAGKGRAYQRNDIEIASSDGEIEVAPNLRTYWGLDEIRCYDPAHRPFAKLPTERFDGVICVDVLEHVTTADLPWVLDEIFGYARGFVFATIACYPAKKLLPNGANVHCTIRPPDWWSGLIRSIGMRHPDVSYRFELTTRTGRRRKLGGLYGKRSLERHQIDYQA